MSDKTDFIIEEAPDVAFGKPKEPNPYERHIEALIANGPETTDGKKGKAVTFTPYPVKDRTMDAKQMFQYVVRKFRADVPDKYSVRSLLHPDGRIQLWLTPKITRAGKTTTPAEAPDATPAETPVAAPEASKA